MPGEAPSTPAAGPCDIGAMRSWVCRGFVSLLLPLAGLAGCGDNGVPSAPDAGAAPDAMAAPDAPFAVGDHPDPPQILSGGGPVAIAPKIVPIFFTSADDDPFQSEVEEFLTELASGDYSYWSEATAEYGVGPLTIEPTVVSTDPTPAGDSATADLPGDDDRRRARRLARGRRQHDLRGLPAARPRLHRSPGPVHELGRLPRRADQHQAATRSSTRSCRAAAATSSTT